MAKNVLGADIWDEYHELAPQLERLKTTISGLIKTGLRKANINILHFQIRLKTLESIMGKIERKNYSNPMDEITDLVGARAILYLESDIELAENVMRELFEIDEDNSTNRLQTESPDSVGYRSLHIVASLGEAREQFPEYLGLGGIKFEIQLRTALQHAWAEIEHKQNYKSQTSLPPKLQRRLLLIAGTLESIDREFSEIVKQAKNYANSLEIGDPVTQDDPISTVAVKAIFSRIVKKARVKRYVGYDLPANYLSNVVVLLDRFGIKTVGDLEELLLNVEIADIKKFFKFIKKMEVDRFYFFLMIMNDSDRYFDSLQNPKKMHIEQTIVNYYEENHPQVKMESQMRKYKISIKADGTATHRSTGAVRKKRKTSKAKNRSKK